MRASILISVLSLTSVGFTQEPLDELFESLKKVKEIDQAQGEQLPLLYNSNFMVGYQNMPSARVARPGNTFGGANYTPPYHAFGANLQLYKTIELSANYRIFNDLPEENFGSQGFGDDADRTANVKFAFSFPKMLGFTWPSLAVGFDDFYGSRRFYSMYVVGTQVLKDWNLELTLGWGKGRIHGYFGGIAFTPWRFSNTFLLKDITFFGEYDAIDYKHHHDEHPDGRDVKSKVNVGVAWEIVDAVQLKVSTLRGNNWAASAGIHYNFGESKGLLPKVGNTPIYTAPVNHEPIGYHRSEKEMAYEIALGLGEQGLNVTRVFLTQEKSGEQVVTIQLINMRYYMNKHARERIQAVLASLIPENVNKVVVVLEEGSVLAQSYVYLREELDAYHAGKLTNEQMKIVSPPEPVRPTVYDSSLLFKRNKMVWSFLARPRMLSFFGSTNGKYKYALGAIAGPQGYLFDSIYYKTQFAYNALASNSNVGDIDIYNPSQLINVRTDTVNYYKSNSVTLEKAYLQQAWNVGKGWYGRVALGYFEAAYAGLGTELLFYPINSNWAVGFECATVLKREYEGLGFQYKVRKLNGTTPTFVPFVGVQAFCDVYYNFKPLNLDLKVQIGQFLARDRGAKFTLSRYFDSGFRVSFWYTATDAKDTINHKIYHDKGVAFSIPFDFFLHKSSRAQVGYGMAFWLRDSGAQAQSGKPLFPTLNQARIFD